MQQFWYFENVLLQISILARLAFCSHSPSALNAQVAVPSPSTVVLELIAGLEHRCKSAAALFSLTSPVALPTVLNDEIVADPADELSQQEIWKSLMYPSVCDDAQYACDAYDKAAKGRVFSFHNR